MKRRNILSGALSLTLVFVMAFSAVPGYELEEWDSSEHVTESYIEAAQSDLEDDDPDELQETEGENAEPEMEEEQATEVDDPYEELTLTEMYAESARRTEMVEIFNASWGYNDFTLNVDVYDGKNNTTQVINQGEKTVTIGCFDIYDFILEEDWTEAGLRKFEAELPRVQAAFRYKNYMDWLSMSNTDFKSIIVSRLGENGIERVDQLIDLEAIKNSRPDVKLDENGDPILTTRYGTENMAHASIEKLLEPYTYTVLNYKGVVENKAQVVNRERGSQCRRGNHPVTAR